MQLTKKLEENKIKTRQQIKKGRSKRCCCRQSTWIIIAPLLHCYRSAVAPLSLRCRTTIAALLLCCRSAVAPLSQRCFSAVTTPLSLRFRAAVAPLLLHCRSAAVAAQLHRYRATVAPLLLLLMSLQSCTAIAPLSRSC